MEYLACPQLKEEEGRGEGGWRRECVRGGMGEGSAYER